MKTHTSLLTITFNCMVAGLCAGILFSIFICSVVMMLGSLSAAGAAPKSPETEVSVPGAMPLVEQRPRVYVTAYACRRDPDCREARLVDPDAVDM